MIEEVFVSLIAIFSISFVSLLWRDIVLLTSSLLILAIFSLRYFHKKNDVIIFFIGAVIGTGTELVCIYFGAWKYMNPTYLIPLWLPVLWGLAAIVIRRFAVEIDNRIK